MSDEFKQGYKVQIEVESRWVEKEREREIVRMFMNEKEPFYASMHTVNAKQKENQQTNKQTDEKAEIRKCSNGQMLCCFDVIF